MILLCQRCGGIITDQQTQMDGENGGKLHYYCSWKNWQEHKEALMKGGQDASTLQPTGNGGGFFRSNWLQKK